MHWELLLVQGLLEKMCLRQMGHLLVLEPCCWLELGQEQTAGQQSRGQRLGPSRVRQE